MSDLEGVDLDGFWEDSDWARDSFIGAPLTDEAVRDVERELGYRLPRSYVALMRTQNGGVPARACFPTSVPTSWAGDHVAISGIHGFDRTKAYSLCGKLGSAFMMQEWGYPDLGVYICDCPSAGHDMVALDYRSCGADGEPLVVHVDQEDDYRITALAPTFLAFVRGLVPEDVFESD